MVKQVQTTDEYYDPYEDDDDPLAIFLPPSNYDNDEQLVLIACLMLLEQRFRLMQSMTPQRMLDEIDDIAKSLKKELKSTAIKKVHDNVYDYFSAKLLEYHIPQSGYVEQDTSMDAIIKQSIDNLVNQLRDELKLKAMFFEDNMSKDDFNILPNFKRAVKKLTDAVGNNLLYSKEKSLRNIYGFVYDEDVLWLWVTKMDRRVCEWCREQEQLPPRPLKDIPLDHPQGRCKIAPLWVAYSDRYLGLVDAYSSLWDIEEAKFTFDNNI